MALRLAASMIAILCAPSAFAQQIVVQPYLQSATPDSVWVMWETDAADDARVDWGPTSGLGEIAMGTTQEGQDGSVIHEVQLDGLSPDTRYYYQVFTGDAQSEVHHFITPPDPASETDFRIVAMSDMQRDGGNPDKWYEVVHDGVLAFTAAEFGDDVAEELAMVLLPGDLVDNGWSYEQWAEEFFEPCADLLAAVPAYPAIGNHEANTPYYFRYFHLPDNGMGEIYTEHWWSVHHSNVRIIGLDSNAAFRIEEQLTWLEEQLDDACLDPTVDFVFAQLHHPYQSELWPAGDTDYTGEVVALLETFTTDCSKPSIHFFGHTHGYSRGQSRDHRHLWVNVASAGGNIDYWDEYDQTDHEQFTVSQDEWGFVMIEVEAGADPRFRLRRVSRGNEDLARDNEVRDEVVVRLHADPPTTPTGLWPADEAVAPDCATLWACPFHDPDDELHGASWWQVSADCADFSSPVLERWVQHENQYGGRTPSRAST